MRKIVIVFKCPSIAILLMHDFDGDLLQVVAFIGTSFSDIWLFSTTN